VFPECEQSAVFSEADGVMAQKDVGQMSVPVIHGWLGHLSAPAPRCRLMHAMECDGCQLQPLVDPQPSQT
jgi:hypothetical protein